jgi:hypothetical protein
MKRNIRKILSALLAIVIFASMFVLSPFAASADIAVKALNDSCMQGDTITVQVYFPSAFNKLSSLDLALNYDTSKLELVSVKKGDGYTAAANAQVNGKVFSENHKIAGTISWSLAGSNNYDFSGVFSEIVFKVKNTAMHGQCDLTLKLKSASNSGYVDMLKSVSTENGSFTIIRKTENDLTFSLNSEKTGYIVSSYLCGSCDYVNIPATHNGLPVVGIDSSAFYNHAEIKTLTIPDTVTSIGFQSFCNCSGIENLVIPNSVTLIDGEAFRDCSGLRNVQMSVALETLGENSFSGCPFLKAIELPFTLTSIGYSAFENCYSLADVRISKNTVLIGSRAFKGCNAALKFTTVDGNTYLPKYITDNSLTAAVNIVKDLSLGTASSVEEQTYTGQAVTPAITVTLTNGEAVSVDKDYKIVYVNNVKGTAKAYVIGTDTYIEGYIVDFNVVCRHTDATKTVGKAATCTEDGYYNVKCNLCGDEFTEVIPALGHTSDKWIYDVLPTIYKTGLKHKVCDRCGEIFEKDTVVPKVYPDVDGNNTINSSDALLILEYTTGQETIISAERLLCADANGDGAINSMDALIVLQITIGSIVLDKQ